MVSIHGYISGTSDISRRRCHRPRVSSSSLPKANVTRTGRPDGSVQGPTDRDALISPGENLRMAFFADVSQGLLPVPSPNTSVVARGDRKLMVGCLWHCNRG